MDGVARWRELLADQDGTDVLDLAGLMQDAPTEGLGAKLGGLVDLALGVLLAEADRDQDRRFVDLLLPLAQRAVADPEATYVTGRGVVAAATLLAGLGVDGPPVSSVSDLVGTWLGPAAAAVDALQDGDRHDWALICAAYGSDGSIATFAETGLAPRLAQAAATGAGIDDVMPDWTAFVADFPASLETGAVRMSCLLHAGHAVYTRFGGHRPDQVLDALREFVRAGMEG